MTPKKNLKLDFWGRKSLNKLFLWDIVSKKRILFKRFLSIHRRIGADVSTKKE